MRIQDRFIGAESVQQTGVEPISNEPLSPPAEATQTVTGNSSAIAVDARGILDTKASLLQKSLHEALDTRTGSGYQSEQIGIEYPNLVKADEPSAPSKNAAAVNIPGRIEYPNLTFLPEVNDEVLIRGSSDTVHSENETAHAYQHNQSDLEF